MPQTDLEALKAEKARRQAAQAQPAPSSPELDALRAEKARREAAARTHPDHPELLINPVAKTGDFALDNRGKSVPTAVFQPSPFEDPIVFNETLPSEFEFDSEEAIRLQRAEEGVDFRRGLPFFQRLQIATSSPIPRARQARIKQTLGFEIQNAPEGLPPLRFDSALQEFQIASQVSEDDVLKGFEKAEDIGKFRYISLDGAGIEMGDIADLMNLGEIGSLVGSVAGAGKGKLVTFGRGGIHAQQAAGAAAGGTAGRLTGDGLSVLMDIVSTDGEFVPTKDELLDMGLTDLQIEALASVAGESLAFGLRKSSNFVQDAYARMTGREGAFGAAEDIARANANVKQTQADMARIKDVTGNPDVSITRGQSAGSIDMVELENSRIKNASPATRRLIEVNRAKNDRATKEFVDNAFGGDLQVWNNRHGVINSANRALEDANVLVTSVDDGIIGFHPMISPDQGLKVRPQAGATNGEYVWQVKGAQLPENLRGIGVGSDLYVAAAKEARAHGAVLISDDNVTEAAMKVWRNQDGSEAFGKLKFNENVTFDDTLKRWVSDVPGEPVVRMEPVDPFLPKLLKAFRQPAQGADGKLVANKEFARFLRRPGRGELGSVVEDISTNRFLRQDLSEAIFDDYIRNVDKNGKFSVKAFEQWKDEVAPVLEKVFTPEEMLRIRKPGGLRAVVDAGRERVSSLESSMAKVLKLDENAGQFLRNPTGKSTVYQQLKNMDINQARRSIKLLNEADMLGDIQQLFKEDLRQILVPKVSGRSVSQQGAESLNKFVKENTTLIRTMFPDQPHLGAQYLEDLRLVARIQERKAMRSVVPGTREEANPSALALTRVAFGPLSRAQRFLTAARRVQTRNMGEAAIEMVSDPQKLRTFLRIKDMPLGSSQVMQIVSRLGFADVWDDRDITDPEVRQEILNEINETRIVMDQVREDG